MPSPALSESSFPELSKQRRVSHAASSHSRPGTAAGLPVWTAGHQERYESCIARLTASANFPLAWVENPEWLAFCDKFVAGATSPTRKVLTNRIIPAELHKIRQQAMKTTLGCEATIQCDGWTALNTHHYIAFMVTTSTRQVNNKYI